MVTTLSAVCFMFVWAMILASYLAFRKRRAAEHAASTFQMPGGIPMAWAVFAFFGFIIWVLTTQEGTLNAMLVTPIWFALLGIAYSCPQVTAPPDTRCQMEGRCRCRC